MPIPNTTSSEPWKGSRRPWVRCGAQARSGLGGDARIEQQHVLERGEQSRSGMERSYAMARPRAISGRGLTRREFIKATGLTAIGFGASPLLQACGRATAVPTAAEIGGAIQFLSWEGYDLRGCMEGWEAAHGVTM